MYMFIYEYIWVFIFLLHCTSCTYRKKKFTQKKEIPGKSQNFVELLPSARPPPEIKILSVLVKTSWKTEIELSP